jgi:predicted glycoside hydrolase/deacetylase ChbG (UPF0249 family)
MRFVILNADDFGLSDGINRGVIQSFEGGIVTSASLMVHQAAAEAAAYYAKQEPRLSLGLHLDFGEWVFAHGEWVQLYSVVHSNESNAFADEIENQLAEFRRLVGREPTHMDSHQHLHREEPIRSLVLGVARRIGVPVREFSAIPYCGDFYGQTDEGESLPDALSVRNLKEILATLAPGLTELSCHPGYRDGLSNAYAAERELEVLTLCSPEIRTSLATLGIQLCSFETAPRSLIATEQSMARRLARH